MASSLEGTRLNVLSILQRQGSITVDQLAQVTGLASATIRRHLDILQRDNLVAFRQVRKKLGRPEYSYFLTEDGQESGYRDYRKLLTLLMSEIKRLDTDALANKGSEELLAFLITRASDQASRPYMDSGQNAAETRTARLERDLTEGGFSPEVSQENGRVMIRLCNCPFRAVALDQQSVCLFDQNLIANILGVEPVRQSTICIGDSLCTYVATLDS